MSVVRWSLKRRCSHSCPSQVTCMIIFPRSTAVIPASSSPRLHLRWHLLSILSSALTQLFASHLSKAFLFLFWKHTALPFGFATDGFTAELLCPTWRRTMPVPPPPSRTQKELMMCFSLYLPHLWVHSLCLIYTGLTAVISNDLFV